MIDCTDEEELMETSTNDKNGSNFRKRPLFETFLVQVDIRFSHYYTSIL